MENVNTTMLVANIDDSLEPTMANKYKKSHILERGNRKIGFIGVILETTNVSNWPILSKSRERICENYELHESVDTEYF